GLQAIGFPADLVERASEDAPLAAAIAGQRKIFETRRLLMESKIAAIRERIAQVNEQINGHQAEIGSLTKRISLLQEEMAGGEQLVAHRLERKPRPLPLQREMGEMEGKRGDTLGQIAQAEQNIPQAQV